MRVKIVDVDFSCTVLWRESAGENALFSLIRFKFEICSGSTLSWIRVHDYMLCYAVLCC